MNIAWFVQMWTACDVCRSGGGTLVGGEGNLEGRVDGLSGRCAVTCEGGGAVGEASFSGGGVSLQVGWGQGQGAESKTRLCSGTKIVACSFCDLQLTSYEYFFNFVLAFLFAVCSLLLAACCLLLPLLAAGCGLWLLAARSWLLAPGCLPNGRQLLAACCLLLAAGYWLRPASFWLLAACGSLLAACGLRLATGCWLLAGCLMLPLLAPGCGLWLLAARCWLLAPGCLPAGCRLRAACCLLLAAGYWLRAPFL